MKVIHILILYILLSINSYANDFHIPSTVSDKAKKVLKSFNRDFRTAQKYPDANDIEGWDKIKKKYISYTKKINQSTLLKFKPEINEYEINGIPIIDIKPSKWEDNKRVIVYIHGGAFTLFDAKSSLYNSVPLASYSKLRVISIDYTTAPQKKWSSILDEIEIVIKGLYGKGYNANSIGIFGDSAGGGIATATVLRLKNKGEKYPQALALWSPWVDISKTGDSYYTLANAEPTFSYDFLLKSSANAYANIDEQKNMYVSPVYAQYDRDFPVTLIQGGTKELLLSNFVRLYQAMEKGVAGVS